MRTRHVVVLALLGAAAIGAAVLWGSGPDRGRTGRRSGVAASRPDRGTRTRRTVSTPSAREGASRSDAEPQRTSRANRDGIPFAERKALLLQEIEELEAVLAQERERERAETAREEQVREAAWSRRIDDLVAKVRADARQADVMVAEMDATGNEALAIRLARILRRAEHPELLEAMQERVTKGESPMQRRTAMLVLETRDAELWLEPVSQAYASDADASVRDEASGVLARSLADRKHITVHDRMRVTIQERLDSDEPRDRVRALQAMLGDRRPRPADLARAKAMLKDEDESVRAAAKRTVRVLESILNRAPAAR